MCSQPIGQVIYGLLIDKLKDSIAFLFLTAFIITALIAVKSKNAFKEVYKILNLSNNENTP